MKPQEWLVIGALAALVAAALIIRAIRRAGVRRATVPQTLAYLKAGGMQSPQYSPKESIAGIAYPFESGWDDFRAGGAVGSQYVSGVYRDYPVLLSKVKLEFRDVDLKEAMFRPRYRAYKFYTYFSGEWFIFRMQAKYDVDLTLIDRRLTEREDEHYPGGTTRAPRCVSEPALGSLYDAYGSSADAEAARSLMTPDAVRVLKKLHEAYRPVIFLRGNKLHIGLSDLDVDFQRHPDETEEEWNARQNLFAALDDLSELIRLWGDPPVE